MKNLFVKFYEKLGFCWHAWEYSSIEVFPFPNHHYRKCLKCDRYQMHLFDMANDCWTEISKSEYLTGTLEVTE